jgi:diguanylate cyclase (GGDEF)-like protein
MGLYLAFQLGAASADTRTALSGFLFFASGVGATVMARRTMNVLAQKSFLLELRDRHRMAELAETNLRLERLSMIDGLTGAANRHFVRERMKALTGRDGKVAVLMCDIDHFKALNDRLGHLEGDRCLVEVARIIMASTRSQKDCVARYGGEEFLVILPDADQDAATTVAERIRKDVAAAALPNPGSRVKPIVTLSVGVAVGSTGGDGPTLEELQLRADTALYVAKRAGRNRVQIWNEGSDAFAKLGSKTGR